MKKSLVLLIVATIIIQWGCKKEDASTNTKIPSLVAEARNYFEDSVLNVTRPININNLRASFAKTILWQKASISESQSGKIVSIPIDFRNPALVKSSFGGGHYYNLSGLTRLQLVKSASGSWRAEVLTSFPDSNYLSSDFKRFTGLLFVEDWYGNSIHKFQFEKDGGVMEYLAPQNSTVTVDATVTICTEIDGYNYSPDNPSEVYEWSEPPVCNTFLVPAKTDIGLYSGNPIPPGGGGGSSGFTVFNGKNPIGNIKDYLKCYTNSPGSDHSYKVTVCVDQPIADSREPWGFSLSNGMSSDNPFDVGHVFLILSETYGTTTIIRNIGFYPQGSVFPGSATSPGQYNDDEGHIYDISRSFGMTSSQFFNILNYIINNVGDIYNLNSFNCTTFAILAMYQGDIVLPNTIGTWIGGMGNDPGDLGEDLRSANVPGAAIPAFDPFHPNVGSCL